MTILNFAVDDTRIFIAVDTAVSKCGLGRIGNTSKVAALPHLGGVIAGHGSAAALSQFHTYAAHLSDARNIVDLIEESRDVLRTIWTGSELAPVRAQAIGFGVLVAGVDENGAKAVYFHSRTDFEPRHYTRGVILSPMPHSLRGDDDTAATADVTAGPEPSDGATAQVVPRLSWGDLVQACVRFVHEQQAESEPGNIGGKVWGTLVTQGAIHYHEHVDLDEPAP